VSVRLHLCINKKKNECIATDYKWFMQETETELNIFTEEVYMN